MLSKKNLYPKKHDLWPKSNIMCVLPISTQTTGKLSHIEHVFRKLSDLKIDVIKKRYDIFPLERQQHYSVVKKKFASNFVFFNEKENPKYSDAFLRRKLTL